MTDADWVEFDEKWIQRKADRHQIVIKDSKAKFVWNRRAIAATKKFLDRLEAEKTQHPKVNSPCQHPKT